MMDSVNFAFRVIGIFLCLSAGIVVTAFAFYQACRLSANTIMEAIIKLRRVGQADKNIRDWINAGRPIIEVKNFKYCNFYTSIVMIDGDMYRKISNLEREDIERYLAKTVK